MANDRDAVLLETVKTHRSRLAAAFLFGELPERRIVNDNIRRFIGGVILAAVACAGCVGFAFVTNILAQQAEAREQQQIEQQQPLPPSTPQPTPSEEP